MQQKKKPHLSDITLITLSLSAESKGFDSKCNLPTYVEEELNVYNIIQNVPVF